MTAMYILCGILILICLVLVLKYLKAQKQANERIELNKNIAVENEKLAANRIELIAETDSLISKIADKNAELDRLGQIFDKQGEERANIAYAGYMEELDKEYHEIISDYMDRFYEVQDSVQKAKDELANLKAKQNAYLEEQLRQEEIQNNLNFYRMILSENDKDDISHLRQLQGSFHRKEAIDKVVWDVYYKPAYDVLMSHLFKKGQDKVCGIYKICSVTTGKVYVGQSVDIRSRWRDHIRAALAFGNKTNLLYSAMSDEGPENFTFEILEEVPRSELNEREKYYIDFYQSARAGLNKTSGGS